LTELHKVSNSLDMTLFSNNQLREAADLPSRGSHVIVTSAADAQLLRRVAAGDHAALEALYNRYERTCYGLAMRMVLDHFLAEEIVQEVFLKLWAAPCSYVPGRGKFSAWLLTLVYNRSIDRLRQAKHSKTAPLGGPRIAAVFDTEETGISTLADTLPDGATTPYEEAWRQEQGRVIRRALRLLPPPEREAISLAYLDGLTQREVAEKLGVPLGTIKSRTHRGLLQLRRLLEREELVEYVA
jgi:RNA polymerase sigma-70 factor (ECF subfamily)